MEDYLQSGLSKREIWEKHTGCKREHGRILEWMRKYGYISDNKEIVTTFAPKIEFMPPKDPRDAPSEIDVCFQVCRYENVSYTNRRVASSPYSYVYLEKLEERRYAI